ncbi:MAG: SufD family Fe-S cluster assembly protein, partial [Candidatus Nanohaloarchaea archaeon]|nr:SufD family Fe-S cluster assembly protein [Candidatus Nanohaloarchaea archaeon]
RAQHTGQHTECNMISRGAADDNGSLVYEGLQDVGDNAADTSSFQHEDTILLSDEAKANAAPKLMIDNSNVEATHAASSGAVDTDTMYYLNSRGIPTATAKRLIVRGFFQPIYDAASSNVEEIIVGEVKAKFESDTDV